jgi:hypothetical protein
MSQSETDFVLSRCARHLADNCKEACKGTMNETHKSLIIDLAKSLTEDVYMRRLSAIRSINSEWADWLHERKEQYVCAYFLNSDHGRRRWGKVTSNSTETINGVFGEARSLPIVYLIEHMIKYQREKYHDRHEQACKWSQEGKRLTQYARDIQVSVSNTAAKLDVEVLERNDPVYRARVQSNLNAPLLGCLEVSVNVQHRTSECPCFFMDEMGLSCSHVKALLLALGKSSTWCSSRYQIDTYRSSYNSTIPSMTISGDLSADETFVPPDYKKPAGRPAKKHRDRSFYRTSGKQRECKACGSTGHYARTCTAPSTEYRYMEHKDKAIRWCRNVEMKSALPEN